MLKNAVWLAKRPGKHHGDNLKDPILKLRPPIPDSHILIYALKLGSLMRQTDQLAALWQKLK